MEILSLLLAIFGMAVLLTILLPVYAIWGGFVTVKLWAWLLVPIFGVKPLSLPQAIAVGLVVGWLTYRDQSSLAEDPDKAKRLTRLLHPFLAGGLMLLMGAIVRRFL